MTLNKFIPCVLLAAAISGCVGTPVPTSSSAAVISSSSEPASSSAVSNESFSSSKESSSPMAIGSSAQAQSSSSQVASSSSAPALKTLTIQENQTGFCSYSGVIESEHNGFLGQGYVNSANAIGADMNWSIDAETAGSYTLSVRYANGGDAARNATINVNDVRVESASFGNAGDWANWQAKDITINLLAGENTIQLEADQAEGLVNIDSVSIVGAGVTSGGMCTSVGQSGVGFYPAMGATNVNPDIRIRLTFDSPPNIAGSGSVQIVDASNNAVVDTIKIGGETDYLGYKGQDKLRGLNTQLIVVQGNAVEIAPHTDKLAYGKTYNVVINNNLFRGNINGQAYSGSTGSGWQFKTKNSGPAGSTVTVDDDGDADFSSVQGALNYVMEKINTDAVINIRKGTYNEMLFLRNKNNVRLVGESRDGVTIRFDNSEGRNAGSGKSGADGGGLDGGRSLFLVEGGDMVSIEKLTILNSHTRGSASTGNQAETIYFNSSNRLVAKSAAFISEQDTLLLKGYSWFYDTLVAGNVDFIWGYSNVALFENSEIRSLSDSKSGGSSDGGGYILQSRVASTNDNGFIFLNSSLTRGKGPAGNSIADGKTYLARAGGSTDSFAFINCKMDRHINAVGWFAESGKSRNPFNGTATYGYREYNTKDMSGNTINLGSRDGAYKLNTNEYNQYYANRALIFKKYNNNQGWNPQP